MTKVGNEQGGYSAPGIWAKAVLAVSASAMAVQDSRSLEFMGTLYFLGVSHTSCGRWNRVRRRTSAEGQAKASQGGDGAAGPAERTGLFLTGWSVSRWQTRAR